VKHLRKLWGLIAVVALVALLSLTYVKRAKAFTLIEVQYLPAVQLVADQSAAICVSNTTTESVAAVIDIYADNGTLLVSKSVTLAPGQTYKLPYKNNLAVSRDIRGVVSLGTASAAVSDLMTFDKTSGEIIAVLIGIIRPVA
jgi:hypothetical protein